jgi:RNA recognition motif-containing protein
MPRKIYVGNLPYSFTSAELEKLFSPYGAVRSAEVINDRNTGQSRGFGFVEMETDEAMQAAIEKLNGSDCEGRPLRVNEARERTPRPSGSYGGGGQAGGGGYGGGGGGGGGRGRGGYGGGRGGDRGDRRDRRDRFDR